MRGHRLAATYMLDFCIALVTIATFQVPSWASVPMAAQHPLPASRTIETFATQLRGVETILQETRRDLQETRRSLEQTRALAQSAWDGVSLTLFGILVGIALAFIIQVWFTRGTRGLAVLYEAIGFGAIATVIHFFDKPLVRVMQWLVPPR